MTDTANNPAGGQNAQDPDMSQLLHQAVTEIDAANSRRQTSIKGLYTLLRRLAQLLKQAKAERDQLEKQIQDLSTQVDAERKRREDAEENLKALNGEYERIVTGLREFAQDDQQEASQIEQACEGIGSALEELAGNEFIDSAGIDALVTEIDRHTAPMNASAGTVADADANDQTTPSAADHSDTTNSGQSDSRDSDTQGAKPRESETTEVAETKQNVA